jgi:hypothetical protein
MRPKFLYATIAKDCDLVAVLDRHETMRHNQRGARLSRLHIIQGRLNDTLALTVQSARSFIQHQNRRIIDDGSGDGNSFLLSTRKERTASPNIRIVTIRETIDELMSIGILGRFHNILFCRIRLAQQDIVPDRTRKENWLLSDIANVSSQPREVQLLDITAVKKHLSGRDIVETEQDLKSCGFTTTRSADKGTGLLGRNVHTKTIAVL